MQTFTSLSGCEAEIPEGQWLVRGREAGRAGDVQGKPSPSAAPSPGLQPLSKTCDTKSPLQQVKRSCTLQVSCWIPGTSLDTFSPEFVLPLLHFLWKFTSLMLGKHTVILLTLSKELIHKYLEA